PPSRPPHPSNPNHTPSGCRRYFLSSRPPAELQLGIHVPGDPANQIPPNFTSTCAMSSSTTYPKMTPRVTFLRIDDDVEKRHESMNSKSSRPLSNTIETGKCGLCTPNSWRMARCGLCTPNSWRMANLFLPGGTDVTILTPTTLPASSFGCLETCCIHTCAIALEAAWLSASIYMLPELHTYPRAQWELPVQMQSTSEAHLGTILMGLPLNAKHQIAPLAGHDAVGVEPGLHVHKFTKVGIPIMITLISCPCPRLQVRQGTSGHFGLRLARAACLIYRVLRAAPCMHATLAAPNLRSRMSLTFASGLRSV
ncbi:hypothetical protein EJB05_09313, partial [Eragrostis curvula]